MDGSFFMTRDSSSLICYPDGWQFLHYKRQFIVNLLFRWMAISSLWEIVRRWFFEYFNGWNLNSLNDLLLPFPNAFLDEMYWLKKKLKLVLGGTPELSEDLVHYQFCPLDTLMSLLPYTHSYCIIKEIIKGYWFIAFAYHDICTHIIPIFFFSGQIWICCI